MPHLKLTYFDAVGRGEPIRVALFLSGLAFEDHRVQYPEFAALKAQGIFPLGSVPVFTIDGVPYAQTASVLRYVARLGNTDLYPNDPLTALRVDTVLDTFNDTLASALTPSFREQDPARKLELRAAFAAGPLQTCCGYAERVLGETDGPFVGGNTLTIADIVVALQVLSIRNGVLDGLSAGHLASFPRVNALADAYLAHPGIQAWRSR
ncbi:MAG: glutathione S-transferase family protein [Myxococcales bacterium]|nr:glutathione S-transferase family protein [Myxococcales bacterium]